MATDKAEKAVEMGKKVKVTIHSGEDEADKGDVFMAHNFRSVLIQRDKEVEIDEMFLNILRHSTITTTIKSEDGKERVVNVPRFSFSVTA